jgi:selenocysteine-specific elongation factor
VEAAGPAGLDAALLAARLTLPVEELLPALQAEPGLVRLGRGAGTYVSASALRRWRERVRAELSAFHARDPLRPGIPREELRARAFARAADGAFEHVLAELAAEQGVRAEGELVALPGHAPQLTGGQSAVREALLEAARTAGLPGLDAVQAAQAAGVEARETERLLRLLVTQGELRRVGEALVHREALDGLKDEVRRRWPPGSRLDVGAFKDLTGLSRKFVIPLLEYLDREKVTRRSGADRTVLA